MHMGAYIFLCVSAPAKVCQLVDGPEMYDVYSNYESCCCVMADWLMIYDS